MALASKLTSVQARPSSSPIPSREVLEQALFEFPGAIVLVTHDRFLLERVATEYLAVLGPGKAKWFASMEQWRSATLKAEQGSPERPQPEQARPKKQSSTKPGKLSYKLQREFDGMEGANLEAEAEVERLEAEAADPALTSDHTRAAIVYTNLKDGQQRVAHLYARWSELETMKNAAG